MTSIYRLREFELEGGDLAVRMSVRLCTDRKNDQRLKSKQGLVSHIIFKQHMCLKCEINITQNNGNKTQENTMNFKWYKQH